MVLLVRVHQRIDRVKKVRVHKVSKSKRKERVVLSLRVIMTVSNPCLMSLFGLRMESRIAAGWAYAPIEERSGPIFPPSVLIW